MRSDLFCSANTSNLIHPVMRTGTVYKISVQELPLKGVLQARDSTLFKAKIKQPPKKKLSPTTQLIEERIW